METNEINDILKSSINKYYKKGCYACDQISKIKTDKGIAIIVNSNDSKNPGMHWLGIFKKNESDTIEFFDSFGMPIEFYSKYFINFLKSNSSNIVMNKKQLQSSLSKCCGEFCIYYLINRSRNIPMKDILNSFSDNKEKNDKQVINFVNENFRFKNVFKGKKNNMNFVKTSLCKQNCKKNVLKYIRVNQ